MCVLFFKPVFMKCNTNVMLLDATQTSLPSLILDNENIVDTNFWGGSDTSTEMKYGTYLKKKKKVQFPFLKNLMKGAICMACMFQLPVS